MRVRVAVGWRRGGALAGQWIARADGARQRGLARGSRAVGSIRFESAQTHEAVQLPASVADLDAALAEMNADNLTHFSVEDWFATGRQLLQKETCKLRKTVDEANRGQHFEVCAKQASKPS